MKHRIHHSALVAMLAALPHSLLAQERVISEQAATASGDADLARQLANPIASLISVPNQNNLDFGIQSGSRSELAFTNAMSAVAGDTDHSHQGHSHGGGCLCGAMTRLANIIAEGDSTR